MDEFIESFINEARELLFQLESDLLLLENQPQDNEVTNSIFRIMHNLKGAAQMYGFDDMQYLTHEFESIFDRIRTGELKVSHDLIDDTLKGKDILLSMLDKDSPAEKDEDLVGQLKSKYSGLIDNETAGIEEKISDKPSGRAIYCILFSPEKEIFERGLNPDRAIEEAMASGKAKIMMHEKKTSWEKQKTKKICQTTWEIYLYSAFTATQIEEIFLFYDKEEYRVFQIPEDELDQNLEYLDFFRNNYGKGISAADHVKECISGLADGAEEIPVLNAGKEVDERQSQGKLSHVSGSTKEFIINVSSQKLDELMNLVSELVISGASLNAHATRLNDSRLSTLIENIDKLTKKFRKNALDLRLIPVRTLLNKFNRQIRDLSKELNKEVVLLVEGEETEIDKTVLKAIESPLMHIIRNSIGHGIEPPEERIQKGKTREGTLKIAAFYSGANVIIQIHDDGCGIILEKVKQRAIEKGYISPDQQITDQELLKLIMEPGFTTSENINLVSGRGVGMDVVRKELNAIGGSLQIDTEKDLGTSMTMKLPTTLSIIDTLMLEVNDLHVLVPLLEIEYCYKEMRENIYERNSNMLQYKNNLVPFVSLRRKFKCPLNNHKEEMVIIINKYDKKYALIVDDIIGEHQAVIKPLGGLFVNQPYFSGASILVDGNLALILDTNYLFNQSVLN